MFGLKPALFFGFGSQKNLYFCLRLKKSEYIQAKTDFWYQLSDIRLKPGCSIFLQGINVTKTHQIEKLNLVGKWKRKVYGIQPKEAWFILTNLAGFKAAIAAYRGKARKISLTFFIGCIGNTTDLFCFKVSLLGSREAIKPRPSLLEPDVKLSPHPAPEVLSLSFCSCEFDRGRCP